MIFVVTVRPDKRAVLGATTHVDGTARLQTVSRATNPRFWGLIKAFKDITSVPVLLNTSFNNDVEPIVDCVEDAVVSFLTTNLHGLVVGDYLIKKRESTWQDKLSLVVSLPAYVKLEETKRYTASDRVAVASEIRNTFDAHFKLGVSREASFVLMQVDGEKTLGELLRAAAAADERIPAIVDEIAELWSRRVVTLRPAPAGAAG
jgi:carbamoyltransferase